MEEISKITVTGKPLVFKALQSSMPIFAKADFITKLVLCHQESSI